MDSDLNDVLYNALREYEAETAGCGSSVSIEVDEGNYDNDVSHDELYHAAA